MSGSHYLLGSHVNTNSNLFTKMGCADLIAKYLLLCVNFVVTLISVIIVGIGVLLLFVANTLRTSNSTLSILPILIIVAGVLLFLISSFGCCGTLAEKPCLLITYAIFMLLLFGGNIYLSILFRGDMDVAVRVVEQQLDNYFEDSETRPAFLVAEGLLKCCGTTGPNAYVDRNLTIPATCCENPSVGNLTIEDINDINNIQLCEADESYGGCSPILLKIIASFSNVMYNFIITIIVILCVGVLSAVYLAYEFWHNAKYDQDKVDDRRVYPPYSAYHY